MNITKLIKPLKIVSAILLGIASLGLLAFFIIKFVYAIDMIKGDWSAIVNYILYFLVLAASAAYAGRSIHMLIKGNNEKYYSSITESLSTLILLPFWLFIDSISLYVDGVSQGLGASFPIIPLIGGIFAVFAFVGIILAEFKKFNSKKRLIFALFAIISAFISILMATIALALETLALVFLIIAILGVVAFGFVFIYKYFVIKEEPKIEETKVEEKSE